MDNSLDLGKIDPPIWRVMISGEVYGPYTIGQLQSFALERRIRPRTMVTKGNGSQFVAAETLDELIPSLKASLKAPARDTAMEKGKPHNYLISFKLKAAGEDALIGEMNSIGLFAAIMPGIYMLSSQLHLKVVKRRLNEILSPADSLFIVDASTNRFACLNLPMESDAHIRTLWDRKTTKAA